MRQAHVEDAYVASVCLAEIHWLREAPTEALGVLGDTAFPPTNAKTGASALGWLEVCEVKARFIEASCLDASGRQTEARDAYKYAASRTPGYRTAELRRWTERLLARACMYSVKKMPSPSIQDLGETYSAFRAWGEFWQRVPSTSAPVGSTALDLPRRQVWKAYYDLLSTILQHDLTYSSHSSSSACVMVPATEVSYTQRLSVRRKQRSEMKRIESTYESILMNETKFPKASQGNSEVEEWTEQVFANWRVFSGPGWTDAELGDGGKRAMSRGSLDVLYRATTKTFHSTPILRQLFTVHAALGEFDLAIHAFDSYMEIVAKGRARARKTGKHEIGADSDDTAMLTASEAIRVLCRYGDREQAEKAMEICRSIQMWLEQPPLSNSGDALPNGANSGDSDAKTSPSATTLQSATLSAAYRAIGISQARWAQLTHESDKISTLLADSNNNLRRARQYDPHSVETVHALALVLAETRDVSGALELIRTTIESGSRPTTVDGNTGSWSTAERSRRLLPLWHLLALCLTAEDEYETAAKMCEAAYEQFGGREVLFGGSLEMNSRDVEKSTYDDCSRKSIVDQMEGLEKDAMVQLKMTQIVLFELMEGAEEAVDMSDELLSLYARLFGKPEQVAAEIVAQRPPTAAANSPSRLGGTLRSIAGSIRPGSARSRRSSNEKGTVGRQSITSREGTRPARPTSPPVTNGETLGPPVAITVTNEDGVDAEKAHHRHHMLHLPLHGRKHRSASPASRSPTRSVAENAHRGVVDENATPTPASRPVAKPTQDGQQLDEFARNAPHNQWPPPTGHKEQPPQQDVRLPVPHPASQPTIPEPQLSSIHERRHKVAVLVRTWLFSAGLYIRAEAYDDAENLIDNAVKLTESLELELAKSEDGTSARTLFFRGWGGGSSIDELWADVFSTASTTLASEEERQLTIAQRAHLFQERLHPYEAIAAYEQALAHYPGHAACTIGLSNILMDIYEQRLPEEEPIPPLQPLPEVSSLSLIKEARPVLTRPTTASTVPTQRTSFVTEAEPVETKERKIEPSPEELNRLAARDRAYMLLSNLTKQGASWDDSEAWYALARAHELSREIGKAKQALWYVVELEKNRPVRPWKVVSPGGYTA